MHPRRPAVPSTALRPKRPRPLTRKTGVESLEVRWLLAIDLSTVPLPTYLATFAAQPTVEVFRPNGASQPDGTAGPTGYGPPQIAHAYGYDQIMFSGNIVGTGAGQTIAIVDAYDTPTIAHDLAAFDTFYGIAAPPSFTRVAQDGSTNYPSVDPAGPGGNNWEVETALDVEWSHALAPQANILLVEANSNGPDLRTATDFARNYPGVSVISMSFGGNESFPDDALYTTPAGHTPITFVASTGDKGNPGEYPAFSPNVLAVGGTTLTLNSSNNISAESGWSGSGGGISSQQAQPGYQAGIVTQSSVKRTIPDVSFDANPSTGAAIYDSYNNGTTTPWTQIGGTSFSAPSWAALIAIADQGRVSAGLPTLDGRSGTLPAIYGLPSSDFHDITSGNNGNAAGVGYDLVTGRGSPLANLIAPALVTSSNLSGTISDATSGNSLSGWTVYDDINNNGVLDPPAYSTFNASIPSPLSIPDGTGNLTSTLSVGALNGSIMDVNVNLTIHHTRDSNLTVTLISPSGTSISLIRNNGGTGANFLNTTLDDQAGTAISGGTATFTGSFRPAAVLSTLNGQNAQGTWQLVVADTVSGNIGVLNNWSLSILTASEPTTTTDGDGVYLFRNAPAGAYNIRDIAPVGFTQTAPATGVNNVTLTAGMNVTGVNFAEQGSSAAGQLFIDSDGNGTLDPGEIGLNWAVFDDLNNNGVWDPTSQYSVASTAAPQAIPDQSTILSTTTANGLNGAITDLNITLSINHTRDADLAVTLISPDGTYVPLINHNGGSGANFVTTTFDDQASTAIGSGTAPFTGSFRPSSVLSALNGKNPNGTWKLLVADTTASNTGTLVGWSMQITTNAFEPLASTDGNGNYVVGDLIAGPHTIREYPTGYTTLSSPASGAYNVNITSLANFTNDNFGNISPIVVSTGGPYTINEGSSLTLNGSATGGTDPYNYSWDLNGDGVYGDATDPAATLSWSQLVALGITGPGTFQVRLSAADSNDEFGDSLPTTLTVLDVPPTANAGGPYTINEGDSLVLSGSGTSVIGSPLTYTWDVNGDGTFGDATGASPTLTWTQLAALGINNGPRTYNVSLETSDGFGGVTISAPVTLSINNVPPTAGISGPTTALRGETNTYTLTANDIAADMAAGFTFTVNWGDGTQPSVITAPSGTQITHAFNTAGALNVSVTATDQDGGISVPATQGVNVAAVQLRPDAQNQALMDLVWGGSSSADHVQFSQVTGTTIRVQETILNGATVNNVQSFTGVTGRVIAEGNSGNDILDARGLLTTQATLDGGAGSNTIYGGSAGDILIGGSNGGEGKQGNNVIIAGNGNNTIYGNGLTAQKGATGGNNLIIGGTGQDTIFGNYATNPTGNGGEGGQNLIIGNGGGDTIYASQIVDGAEGGHGSILIAGTTNLNQAALQSILSEWTSTHTLSVKVANISGTGTGSGFNGTTYLQPGLTVFNDNGPDTLYSDSNGSADWLLATLSQDKLNRPKSSDIETDLP